MTDHRIIEDAKEYVRSLLADNSDGHDFGHTMRVYNKAMEISHTHLKADRMIVALTAILHDVDDHKITDSEDNDNARAFLEEHDVDAETVEKVISAINSISYSQNKGAAASTLEAQIVQDADRLDAVGSIAIGRAFAYAGAHGNSFESAYEHLCDKSLRVTYLMNTDEARVMAEKRHAFLILFLEGIKEDTKGVF